MAVIGSSTRTIVAVNAAVINIWDQMLCTLKK
jgi:hypothetical protein